MSPTQIDGPAPREDGRLPADARPIRYLLDLTIDPAKPTFTGRAVIAVKLEKPGRTIVLHGRGLTIQRTTIMTPRGQVTGTSRSRLAHASKVPEELVVTFDDEIPAGHAELEFVYEAPFADGLVGLYSIEEGGARYAFTQEAARRTFPCFDEPGYKTPFEVRISVPKDVIAVANMPEARRTDRGELVTFEFAPSPPLPTYLVAFAVGPFEIRERAGTPVPVRLVATKGKTAQGEFALEAVAVHLDQLHRYFDRPYPYAKLDVVAVPRFAYGAMENAGLVMFQEDFLLSAGSTGAQRFVSRGVAHELSHQWFGNLVTMQWWDDAWLNEGFASWMGDKMVDRWHPGTHELVNAVRDKVRAMEEDALASAPKIRNPIKSTDDLGAWNPLIIYDKSKAVLTMVERWIGEDAFRDGVRRYIKKHEWGSVTASDLYEALGEVSGGRNVAEVMESFTEQSGVPSVSAQLVCARDAVPSVQLRQREYRTLDRAQSSEKLWRIPVCVTFDAGAKVGGACTLLGGAETKVDLPLAPGSRCPSIFYANQDEQGYYRVAFDRADLGRLTGAALTRLTERERYGLLSNAWAQVWSGDIALRDYLDLLPRFQKDTSVLVWGRIFDALRDADRIAMTDAVRPAFAKWVRDLVGPIARRTGWIARKGEAEDTTLLRASALSVLGTLGEDSATLAQARRTTEAWLANPAGTDGDMARMAVQIAAKHGDSNLFDRLVTTLKGAKTPDTRTICVPGLASFDDPALAERALDLALDGTIKDQGLARLLHGFASRPATRDVLFTWLEKHAEALGKIASPQLLGDLPRFAAATCDPARVESVQALFDARLRSVEGGDRQVARASEDATRCRALAAKERPTTEKWLRKLSYAGGLSSMARR
jgi:aminopeptidase N